MSHVLADLKSLIRPGFVHQRVYTEQAIFDLEMDRIFGKVWLYAAHESQLQGTGDFVRARLGRHDVIVTRHSSGEILALMNRCPHRGSTVCAEPKGHVRQFVCPYHKWSFGLDGRLLGVPHRQSYPDEFVLDDNANALARVARVATYRGFVFASLAQTGPSLEDFLGPMLSAIDNLVDRSPLGEIELAETSFKLEYRGNWKMHHENANDTIHPGVVHESSVMTARRQTAEDSDFDKGQTRQMLQANGFGKTQWESIDQIALPGGHSYMGGIYRSGLLAAGERDADPAFALYLDAMYAHHGRERTAEILGLDRFNNLIYPNLNINAQYHQLRVVHPVAPDRTLVVSHCFKLAGAPDAIFHRAVRFLTNLGSPASMIYGDDAEIFERCNAGLRGSESVEWINMQRGIGFDRPTADGGLVAPATEATVRSMFDAWLALMTEESRP